MTDPDPCTCDHTCDHGQRCLAGHANYPNAHWYPCPTCTPMRQVTFDEARNWRQRRLAELRQQAAHRADTMTHYPDTDDEIADQAAITKAMWGLQRETAALDRDGDQR